jgi:hypothetical protein
MSYYYTLFTYLFYFVGYTAVLYIILLITRHIILYYIIKALKHIRNSLPKFNTKPKKADATDREDELKRDQEVEIFKQQANEIKARINKNKEDDTIAVEVEKISNVTSQGETDAFMGGKSRLDMGQEIERIVGVAKPIGKWTGLVLGKKMSQIASIMQHQQQMRSTKDGYWTAYIKARKSAETEVYIKR